MKSASPKTKRADSIEFARFMCILSGDYVANSVKLGDVLPDAIPITDIGSLEEAEERGFQLYREATILVTVIANTYYGLPNDEFPLDRNQAILSGLLIRIAKFMRVVIQLAAERANGEVIGALNRCVLETSGIWNI